MHRVKFDVKGNMNKLLSNYELFKIDIKFKKPICPWNQGLRTCLEIPGSTLL
jgi:hypothetical protein